MISSWASQPTSFPSSLTGPSGPCDGVPATWMSCKPLPSLTIKPPETVIQSEISQKEKNKYRIISLTCGI